MSGKPGEQVFPAPAGINRELVREGKVIRGVPRASGDKPVGSAQWMLGEM
ncbi:hypothetical protein SEEM973_19215, partial [Salmonella enterica subsp. enterica serovar Montevideo str. 495297-3]